MENEVNVTYSVTAYIAEVENEDNIIDWLNYCDTLSEVFNFIDKWDTIPRKVDHFVIKTVMNGEVVAEEKLTKYC